MPFFKMEKKMADGAEVCGMTMGAGALFGTLAGLGVGIWVAVEQFISIGRLI